MSNPGHQTIIPSLRYDDAPAVIDWLREIFGMTEHFVVREGDQIEHGQIAWRGSILMLGSMMGNPDDPHNLPYQHGSTSLTAESAEQVDEIYARAVAAGATIIQPLTDTEYGSHAFTIADAEGNHWHLGTYDALAMDQQ